MLAICGATHKNFQQKKQIKKIAENKHVFVVIHTNGSICVCYYLLSLYLERLLIETVFMEKCIFICYLPIRS